MQTGEGAPPARGPLPKEVLSFPKKARQVVATEAEIVFAAVSRLRNVFFRHANVPVHAAGLTVTQFEVLEALSAYGPLSVGGIGEAIFGTPGNVPVVVRNLERDGLVQRSRSAEDGRVSIISLTPEGAFKIEVVYPQVVESLGRDLASLSPEEQMRLVALLNKALRGATGEGNGASVDAADPQ